MKFFIVTSLKEKQDEVFKILKQANIIVFSSTDIIGFKENQSINLLEEWFSGGDEKFDSRLTFSFTRDENAETGLEMIKEYNVKHQSDFPIRAFIVPVEKASY